MADLTLDLFEFASVATRPAASRPIGPITQDDIRRAHLEIGSCTMPAKLRKLADGMQKEIDRKRDSNSSLNPTRRRLEQQQAAHKEADRLEQQQRVLRALAIGYERCDLPLVLTGSRTKEHMMWLACLADPATDSQKYNDRGRIYRLSWREFSNAPRLPLITTEAEFETARAWVIDALDGRQESEHARQRKLEMEERDLAMRGIDDFYPTPPEVIDLMLDYHMPHKPGQTVLEPSAGTGTLACRLLNTGRGFKVTINERNHSLYEHCVKRFEGAEGVTVTNKDFLDMEGSFDLVVMNPPFSKGLDMQHVRHAYELLAPGGRLISVMAVNWQHSTARKNVTAFQDWFNECDGRVIEVPSDAFTKSTLRPVGVSTCIVILDKGE